ncbi:MAG: phosphoserine transaminase [Verrucomicrobiota bacterium]|nr:phosphoserine transaminase [Verrucomicrobiota bacterium]
MKPSTKPNRPFFSSGPCSKRPGWSLNALSGSIVGRSHRSKPAKARIREVIDLSSDILGLPKGYVCGIVPASDTGAVEMAMWSLLGERAVEMCAWESFGFDWVTDAIEQLGLEEVNHHLAEYGKLPDFSKVDCDNDVVFTYNGTTSGVKVPNLNWISDNRKGLTICDATSAVFAMDIDFRKLDVVTWSWQKVMGGEGAHGMIVLSPRAINRLKTYKPTWPLPKIFRMTKERALIDGIFSGATINTVSLICVEDAVDGLRWAESIGGLPELIKRSEANLKAISEWVHQTEWIDFLAEEPATISNTSICLKITAQWYQKLPANEQVDKAKQIVSLLEKEGVGFDFGSYRDAPAGLRIWGGATVETADIIALLPWIEWAFTKIQNPIS